jgi:hypothetical protein
MLAFGLQQIPGVSLVSKKFCKRTVDSPSHHMFRRMYEALNIDKKIKLIT